MPDQKEVTATKQRYEQEWMALEEVTAIGIGKVADQIGIVISVTENPEKVKREIPDRIEGIPIKIQKTGELNVQ